MRVSEARDLIQRLVEATREYDDPQWRRRGRTGDTSALEGILKARIGGSERLLTKVANRVERPFVGEVVCILCGKDDHVTSYCKLEEREKVAQANAAGEWQHKGPKRDPFAHGGGIIQISDGQTLTNRNQWRPNQSSRKCIMDKIKEANISIDTQIKEGHHRVSNHQIKEECHSMETIRPTIHLTHRNNSECWRI